MRSCQSCRVNSLLANQTLKELRQTHSQHWCSETSAYISWQALPILLLTEELLLRSACVC